MNLRAVCRSSALLVGTSAFVACGDAMMAPATPAPTVTGNWTYEALGLSGTVFGGPLTCDYGLEMFIPGSGATFVGIYSQARLFCSLTGTPELIDFGQGNIVSGSLIGNQVMFDIDSETIHNTGTLVGDGMSGQVEIQLVVQVDSSIDTVVVAGAWTATR